MPVWNRAHLVRNAIRSILDQTFPDYEFLIVNDGSTDHTKAILKDLPKGRIRVVHQPHKGLVEALTVGNQLAQGEIIVKQDSDDISFPDRLEVIDRYFKEHPDTDFFYHGMYRRWDEDDNLPRRDYIPARPIVKEDILREQYVPGCFAYTKEAIEKVPYRKLHCSEDWMLVLDMFLSGRTIGFLNQGLYDYIPCDDSHSFVSEDTERYGEDEKTMREILSKEYGIRNFKYANRA